jgi:DegV family protein with EDD domain
MIIIIQIVTDSCNDLPQEIIKEYNIHIVPLYLYVDGENYQSGINIGDEEALHKIAAARELPTTSQPAPADFQKLFEEIKDNGPILCLTLTSKLSGTNNSANLAAKNTNAQVTVYDTFQGTFGQGFQVLLAAEMAKAGHTIPEIISALNEYRKESYIYVALETLENAIKGGRINRAQGTLAKALNIKAIVEVKDGNVNVYNKLRGSEKTFKRMLEIFSEKKRDFSQMIIGIAHFNCPEKAQNYKQAIMEKLKPKAVILSLLNPTIAVYAGNKSVAVSLSPDPISFIKRKN